MAYRIKWAAKVHPNLLRRFYKMSESGVIDDELIDDVGLRLYLRCESIMMTAQASFYCPECKNKIIIDETIDKNHERSCNNCNFMFTAAEFYESYRHRELLPGNAGIYFEKYYNEYLKCRTPNEKIIMIDTLIHSFHIDIKRGAINRAAGNNLIEGSHEQVVKLLNELSGIQPENDVVFAETAELMWRRRGKRIN